MPDITTTDRIRLLRDLRAVRRFRPDPVPQHVIDDLLEVACWTGSASNSQPWELILVRHRKTLRALATVDGPPGTRRPLPDCARVVLPDPGQHDLGVEGLSN